MLNQEECDIIKHLHDAGKSLVEITGIIERRRVALSKDDYLLTDVIEYIQRVIFFYD